MIACRGYAMLMQMTANRALGGTLKKLTTRGTYHILELER